MMQGIMDLLRQQLQVSQAALNGARPTNGQNEQQVQASPAVPNGNTPKTEAPAFQAGSNGNEARMDMPERQVQPYIPPPARNQVQTGGHADNQGQNIRDGRDEQMVQTPPTIPNGHGG